MQLQTSLRNSRFRHAGMCIASMVREGGLNANKMEKLCFKPKQLLRITLLLELCLDHSSRGHCYLFFTFIQRKIKVYNTDGQLGAEGGT